MSMKCSGQVPDFLSPCFTELSNCTHPDYIRGKIPQMALNGSSLLSYEKMQVKRKDGVAPIWLPDIHEPLYEILKLNMHILYSHTESIAL